MFGGRSIKELPGISEDARELKQERQESFLFRKSLDSGWFQANVLRRMIRTGVGQAVTAIVTIVEESPGSTGHGGG